MKRRIRFHGVLIFLAAVTAVSMPRLIFSGQRPGPSDKLLDAAGIALILFGYIFRISARGYKEEKSSNGHALVRGGAYGITRNPMYFGIFMIGIGVSLLVLKWQAALVFLAVFLAIYLNQIKKEEAVLLNRFKEEYENYRDTTPAFFPRMHNLFNFSWRARLKMPWIKKELNSFIAVIIVVAFALFFRIK